ncbi:MAG: NAD(P)/FAD-dependent oxidoreductase [Halioglobus sp.]
MSELEQAQTITGDNAAIAAALEEADIPSLMLALVHLTGDMSALRGEIKPLIEFLNPEDGLTDEQRQRVRSLAVDILARHRDDPQPFYQPTPDDLREMMTFLVGEEISDDYVEFLTAELSLQGEDPYAQPEIFKVPETTRADFKVVVIGAGMSGLLSAIRLQEAGIPFVVLEKNADLGGTWYENTYPGCRVDSANHTYSYSFRPQDWPQHFSGQKVLRQYFSDTADDHRLREHIRFNTELKEARYDEAIGMWHLEVHGPNGTESLAANAVISAVGQLNRPQIPEIPGAESFAGPRFHSAQWQHEHDLAGKRIGVIGTGGSAFQFIPILAEQAESVTIFQRTPPWIVPNEQYFEQVPAGKHWLLRHVPFYAKWFRFSIFWRAAEGPLQSVTVQEGWHRPEESVSEANAEFREALLENLQDVLGDRPDLLEKCTPHYPPGAKRVLIDDGKYLRTLKRDNVTLLTDGVDAITTSGVRSADGEEHEFDVLIYGTGFKASSFLFPMKIFGRNGRELQDVWQGDPQAFKGVNVPGFPNFFCCYGPNTNIVVNSSIVFFSECGVRYILGCLALLMQSQGQGLDVKQEVHDRYNRWIDEGNRGMAWGQSGVNTWYKNASGKITQNWPFTLLEFWQQTRVPDAEDYDYV